MPRRTARRAGTPRTQDPEGTRRDILEVARREFARNGLSGARVDEIAARTRASKRMLYYYFEDKDGLYRAVLEQAYGAMRETEAGLDLDHLAPVDALRRLVEFTFDHHSANEDFIRLVMIENIHHGRHVSKSKTIRALNVTAIETMRRIYSRGVESGAFRRGLDPLELHWQVSALCFFNVSNRATFSQIFGRDMASPKALVALRREVVDMVLRYVCRSERDPV